MHIYSLQPSTVTVKHSNLQGHAPAILEIRHQPDLCRQFYKKKLQGRLSFGKQQYNTHSVKQNRTASPLRINILLHILIHIDKNIPPQSLVLTYTVGARVIMFHIIGHKSPLNVYTLQIVNHNFSLFTVQCITKLVIKANKFFIFIFTFK